MNLIAGDDNKLQSVTNVINGMLITQEYESDATKTDDSVHEQKMIYNHTVDAFTMIENSKGFLCANVLSIDKNNQMKSAKSNQQIGIYSIRWRRAGDSFENESKLLVNCIEIVEAPLNIYCFLDEKMYVKVPMTLKITLRNVTNSTIHLKSWLKNADNFMFAGHSQVSSMDSRILSVLLYNLLMCLFCFHMFLV